MSGIQKAGKKQEGRKQRRTGGLLHLWAFCHQESQDEWREGHRDRRQQHRGSGLQKGARESALVSEAEDLTVFT